MCPLSSCDKWDILMILPNDTCQWLKVHDAVKNLKNVITDKM